VSGKVKLAASILSADFARLGEQVAEVTRAGADYIHIDVMDGHFVPNITIGIPVVAAIRPWTSLPLDVHLMIEHPERYITDFARAGADIITVHAEACLSLHDLIKSIKELKVKAGVSISPATPPGSIEKILPDVDLVLVMSVEPGYGGQSFIPSSLDKIATLRKMLDARKLPAELAVDGGITLENAPDIVTAGADVLAIGNSIFNAPEGIERAIKLFIRATG
jgi:ribulose-phosphate 3-epimerase